MRKKIGRLHVLTDFHFQQRFSHADLARLAVEGGADTIQFRQKEGGIRHILRQACETAEVCRELGVQCLIDDRLDVMLACAADGIHLGQTDLPIEVARRILGEDAVIGGSASTVDEAVKCERAGADYVGFGPVFPTGSKKNPSSVRGLEGLAAVCSTVRIPVIAIAGMNAERAAGAIGAGAYGVAVMTDVTSAADPAAAARRIREAIDRAVF